MKKCAVLICIFSKLNNNELTIKYRYINGQIFINC